MEVYVRLNDSSDKDYAFQFSQNDTINNKVRSIFTTDSRKIGQKITLSDLMVIRPSIFHEYEPVEYYKSNHPGYMTEGGCLLFHFSAGDDKNLEKLDYDKPLIDQMWPGQLIVPKWKKSKNYVSIYAMIILVWLYTDLPDIISPTPGHSLTNTLSKLLIPILENQLGQKVMAAKLREEIVPNYNSVGAQWAFFALHVLKVLFITFFFHFALANPFSFNPIKLYKIRNVDLNQKNEKIKNLLANLGWIGARRATYDDYQTNFYDYTIKKYGGVVQAYRAGAIKTAAAPGFVLNAGEGFQSPLDERFTADTFKRIDQENPKFILSEEYFIELENNLKELLDNADGDIGKMNTEIRRFRRYGMYEPSEKLKHLVEVRKEIYKKDKEIEEGKKTANKKKD
ncbi:similar to Saccharomyces cerevisiae YML048W GSF2 ER localized integral membrane protein that may promote secretion of certain hexose transporters, including Gal2p [Maudiozyma saulgeensis]|uniref:Similar to Saccharomyces cerevisiae YML048W GSF2 ER localized integral membrane protein that may promote secretion of certain hexose transporters, including Gal2p n=1 Tax=Maudiozyma saulgeensis TaxID=1789683 RepID=A0A1X7R195_9SACH|nr:similar to Saccharomyces cerevisiae YML048W GSF2 ER localized integral membrane protein that may promote secretion of certain hexose transporters, including Gal2p [Kazachstania saulgeensis]